VFRRLGKPSPDARAAPPDAHESLIGWKTVAEVPLAGLSLAVMNFDTTAGSNPQRRLPPTGGMKMISTDALNLLSTR
jgi:hypothetical protein